MSYLCVLGSQLVEDVGGVEACVVAQLPGDDFQGLGVRSDEQLLLSRDGPGIVAQVLGQLHLDGSSTRHNRVILAIFETVKVGKKKWIDSRLKTSSLLKRRLLTLMALRTIMMASCSDRSVSSVNCSAPPLRMMVHVFAFGQPLKKLYLREHTSHV